MHRQRIWLLLEMGQMVIVQRFHEPAYSMKECAMWGPTNLVCYWPRQHATLMELNARGLESDAVSIGILVNERSFLDKQYMQESSHKKRKVWHFNVKSSRQICQVVFLRKMFKQVRIDRVSLFVGSMMSLQASPNICNIKNTMRAINMWYW